MTTQTTKVKNGTLILPKKLKKSWENAKVFLECFDDSIVVKKIYTPKISFKEMVKESQKAFKGVKKQEVNQVLKEIRNEQFSK